MGEVERKKQVLMYLNMTDNPRIVMGEDIKVPEKRFDMLVVGIGDGIPVNLKITRNGLKVYKSTTKKAIDSDCLMFNTWRKGQVIPRDEIGKEDIVQWLTEQLQKMTETT